MRHEYFISFQKEKSIPTIQLTHNDFLQIFSVSLHFTKSST